MIVSLCVELAPPAGLEPATYGLTVRRSTDWTKEELKFGSLDWTWTSDIRINSPPFYRLNYEGTESLWDAAHVTDWPGDCQPLRGLFGEKRSVRWIAVQHGIILNQCCFNCRFFLVLHRGDSLWNSLVVREQNLLPGYWVSDEYSEGIASGVYAQLPKVPRRLAWQELSTVSVDNRVGESFKPRCNPLVIRLCSHVTKKSWKNKMQ